MNNRQQEILKTLLTAAGQPFLVNDLAERVGCSEKTIRNDFKKIEDYLTQHSNASLIRKPGLGVYLEIADHEKVKVFNKLHLTNKTPSFLSDDERTLQIAYQLLMGTKALSALDFSSQYFVNRNIIKKDLEVIKEWLNHFDLLLVSKQKHGLSVEGSEGNKRKALSKLPELVNNQELTNHFIKKQFSSHEIDIVLAELKKLQSSHSIFFADESLESLLVHTLFMIKRVKLNQPISVYEKEKSALQNKQEYMWTNDYLHKLEHHFSLRFPEDEVIYLTLHILGGKFRYRQNGELAAKLNLSENNDRLTKLLAYLIERMSDLHALDFTNDITLKEGLKVHLYTTLNRLQYSLAISNPMLNEIKNMYPFMFNMIITALDEAEADMPFKIPEEEAAYLTLHFQAAVERFEKNEGKLKQAVIVCHMGIGMSQLLRTKIERKMRLIHIKGCISKEDLKEYLKDNQVDLIISTVGLSAVHIPHIVVSPLFEAAEEQKLREYIMRLNEPQERKVKQSNFMNFTNPFLVFLQIEKDHPYTLIEELATGLYKKGYVEEEFIANTIAREKMSSTTIGAGIAIPHGNPKFIKQSAIAIATLKKPLTWGTELVSLVFMIAVKNDKPDELKALFQELSYLCEQPEQIQSLIREKDTMSFLEKLNNM
ncbi:BglG family transcription antiterminator [Bacillus sp. 1P06AnD]|uniref:BglG family transcription antiterminator n=1 Tax=Bacillus sp. 1P06AnD TaxID=3132208 RepID=UPI0039A1A105